MGIHINDDGTTLNISILCTLSNEDINVCEIVGCFSFEQVQCFKSPMMQTVQTRRF